MSYWSHAVEPCVDATKTIYVYIPPSLVENPIPRSTNTLLLTDGQILPIWQTKLDSLVWSGSLNEVVLVGISSPTDFNNRTQELTPTVTNGCSLTPSGSPSGGGEGYLDFTINIALPLVLSTYSLTSSRSQVGIAGYSLGGLMACHAAITRSNHISVAHCSSTSFWRNCGEEAALLSSKPTAPRSNKVTLYIDYGLSEVNTNREDPTVIEQPALAFIAAAHHSPATRAGQLSVFVAQNLHPETHNPDSWLRRFLQAAPNLFGPGNPQEYDLT